MPKVVILRNCNNRCLRLLAHKMRNGYDNKVESKAIVNGFLYRAMSYSCAKWAVNTALDFAKAYSKMLGVSDKFSSYKCL